MPLTPRVAALPAAALWLALLPAGTAEALCFDDEIGCTDTAVMPYEALQRMSCDALWSVRNLIFHERRYCFKTERAVELFGNVFCRHESIADVPLNDFERRNVARIMGVERENSC